MNRKWMVLDANGLCWAAFHACGGLSYNNTPTAVAYGFLCKITALERILTTDNVAICFDYGKSKRYDLLPNYKSTRKKQRDESEEARAKFASVSMQIDALRTKHLKSIGYRNVFYHKGFEADDLIASVCLNLPEGDTAVIVSADTDMYQLLSNRVSIYNGKGPYTKECFIREYGMKPKQWAKVKAIAGCSSDDVPGIKGIGVKTAVKYLLGTLKPGSKHYLLIQKELGKGLLERNMPLVRLPFEGTPDCVPRRQKRPLTFTKTFERLNIKSIHPDGMPRYKE